VNDASPATAVDATDVLVATAAAVAASSAVSPEWDPVASTLPEKLGPLPRAEPATAKGKKKEKAGKGQGSRSKGKGKNASGTQALVGKALNNRAQKVVRNFINKRNCNGAVFQKNNRGHWQLRRDQWPAFLDYIHSSAECRIDAHGDVDMVDITTGNARGTAPVLPSSTVLSPPPPDAGSSSA
jgi:hypothetical protein